jgi:hypothetical protein
MEIVAKIGVGPFANGFEEGIQLLQEPLGQPLELQDACLVLVQHK